MNAENIDSLKVLLEGKITPNKFPIIRKKLADVDDDKLPMLTAVIGNFKSGWITFILNWFGDLGSAYLGSIGKTIAFWVLSLVSSVLIVISMFMPLVLNQLMGLDPETGSIVTIVVMIIGFVLSFILFIWWIFDVFGAWGDTKKYNYEKFLNAIS